MIPERLQTVSWSLHRLTEHAAFIVDDNLGGMSVTNAAELVCEQCCRAFGDRRIIYCDSMGHWDELVHAHGSFIGFSLYRGEVPS